MYVIPSQLRLVYVEPSAHQMGTPQIERRIARQLLEEWSATPDRRTLFDLARDYASVSRLILASIARARPCDHRSECFGIR
jgi:hypothetical protein